MKKIRTAEPFVPKNTRTRRSRRAMKKAVDKCRGCDLYRTATQGVFGEGPQRARIMLIGEQPGNQEDLSGRLHQKPSAKEIEACRPWLEAETQLLVPDVIVCLGATAAQAVFGKKMPVLENRRKRLESPWSTHTVITVHPSAILRIEDKEQRHHEFNEFVKDLRFANSDF